MKSEKRRLAANLVPFYEQEDGQEDDDLFAPLPIQGLPARLSAVAAAPPRSDEMTRAMNRAEEQSLLRSDSGLETAKAVRKKRAPPSDEEDDEEEGERPIITEMPESMFRARDTYDDAFFQRIDRLNQEPVSVRPSLQETLVYAASLKNSTHGLWLQASQLELIRQNKSLDSAKRQKHYRWPLVPECTRAYLEPFWFEPNRALKRERPCSHVNCESLRLGGFRLREWVSPEEWAKVMATKDRAPKDGGQWLPELPGWCVMCHLCVTNELYLASFNRLQEKRQINGVPDEEVEHQLYRIHHFCVHVDKIGEYKLCQTLPGHPNIVGLFGFFPVYNVQNYIAVKKGTTRGWRESDELVFRPAQAASDPIESSRTTRQEQVKHSVPSGPTGQPRPNTGSRQ